MIRVIFAIILVLFINGCHTGNRFLDNIDNIEAIQENLYREASGSIYQVYAGTGMGSGWAYSSKYIVTNSHVILNSNNELVETPIVVKNRNTIAIAEVIAWDASRDIAVLEIGGGASPLRVDKRIPSPGSFVFSFGAPHGIGDLMSCGTVLGPPKILGGGGQVYFPHSADIAPGSSGGPVVNIDGEVVGMNTLIVGTGMGEYISMAIPSYEILYTIEKLLEKN